MDMIFGDKVPLTPLPSRSPSFNVQTGLSIAQSGELGSLLRSVVVIGPTTFTVTLVAFSRGPLKAMTGIVCNPIKVPTGIVIFIVSNASPPGARKTVDGVNVTIGQKLMVLLKLHRKATGVIVMLPEKPRSLTSVMVLLLEPPSWIVNELGSALIPNPI